MWAIANSIYLIFAVMLSLIIVHTAQIANSVLLQGKSGIQWIVNVDFSTDKLR
jgi:hypothetical protein